LEEEEDREVVRPLRWDREIGRLLRGQGRGEEEEEEVDSVASGVDFGGFEGDEPEEEDVVRHPVPPVVALGQGPSRRA